jgi:ferritin-like metal-binding protein YciE
MAELQERDAKLVQYLNEAYGKEKELETALQAHIQMTTRATYKKRLKDHLKETKGQSKNLQRRIKAIGGKAEAMPAPGPDVVAEAAGAVTSIANKAVSAAKGPLHAVRGTSEQEMMLKNAKTEFWNEHEEIANYNAIETLAEALGDKETAKLARDHRRQEERMVKFLEKTIPQLTKEVVKAEIPASQRNGGSSRRRSASSSRSRSASTSPGSPSRARKTSAAGKGTTRSTASKASSARSPSARSSGSKASATRSSGSKSKASAGSSRRRSSAGGSRSKK